MLFSRKKYKSEIFIVKNNLKVLITGADGFIGSHLTEALVDNGYDVRAFVYYNSFNSYGWIDTFSYRDACPNALIEAMALGLPVVGIKSGGVGDIVGDAGILVDMDDFENGFYSSHRFDNDFPIIDFHQVLNCITNAHENLQELQKKVKNRFHKELNMDLVSSKYFHVINQII